MKKYFLITFLFLITSLNFAQDSLSITTAQLDTAAMCVRSQVVRHTKYGYQKPYGTIQSAITASDSGDCVTIKTGYYDLGSDSLKLKNGVDLFCYPNVTISSSNSSATITDSGIKCVLNLYGFPVITNSNSLNSRIILTSTNSAINGFYWEYICSLVQNGTDSPVPIIYKNTLGGNPTWSRTSTGLYKATLTNAFKDSCTQAFVETDNYINRADGTAINFTGISLTSSQDDYVSLNCILTGTSGPPTFKEINQTDFQKNRIIIRVYPGKVI